MSDSYLLLRNNVRGEEIGMIEQQQILDLFCEHMAPIIYNKALDDAQYWYKQLSCTE